MNKKHWIILGLLLLIPVLGHPQCAMCRAVLESGGNTGAAEAINDGIIYLMIIPYVLIGGLGFFIYRAVRKRKHSS